MIDAQVLGTVAGGLGLFLLGMGLMTDGLKLAAGPALHRILTGATRTRAHALGSGVLVTALVQSPSAVTVAAIGFVNAGLLALGPALWVLFGANVGTTMTGWIVALVGLKFKVEALAMPLVALGALLRLTGQGRRSALGTALAGFGLLFMGIALLQQAFAGLAGRISLPEGEGPLAVLAQLGIGLLMTVLMQSSSAAMAITLTAAQGGLIGPQGAAAVVIGANIGTTVTALLAAIGATPNARRAASAHVVFNLLTGAVALLSLPWLVGVLGQARAVLGLPPGPAAQLALFHTTFNLLGVLLMWPLADRLTYWLQRRFRAREEDEAQAQFLDATVLAVPTLALDALAREVACRPGGAAHDARGGRRRRGGGAEGGPGDPHQPGRGDRTLCRAAAQCVHVSGGECPAGGPAAHPSLSRGGRRAGDGRRGDAFAGGDRRPAGRRSTGFRRGGPGLAVALRCDRTAGHARAGCRSCRDGGTLRGAEGPAAGRRCRRAHRADRHGAGPAPQQRAAAWLPRLRGGRSDAVFSAIPLPAPPACPVRRTAAARSCQRRGARGWTAARRSCGWPGPARTRSR